MIVAGVQEGDLPHARSISEASDPEGELEGERRLAYVAFTRAVDRLVILHAAGAPSRFIAEAALLPSLSRRSPAIVPHAARPKTETQPEPGGTATSGRRAAP